MTATILLDAGAGIPLTAHGALGTAIACSPDRKTVLDLLMRFIKFRAAFSSFTVEPLGRTTKCTIRIETVLGDETDSALDFMLAVLMSNVMFTGLQAMSQPKIHLKRSRPPEHEYYRKLLHASIRYNQREDCIFLNSAELKLSMPTYDPEQFEEAVRKCRLQQLDNIQHNTARESIEHVFDKTPGMLWSIGQVAEHLHMSARTLQRRLKAEGVSYQHILDEWLQQLAAKYMNKEQLTVEATAILLGYNDEANFRRAFKRWHGCPPQAYRVKMLDEESAG